MFKIDKKYVLSWLFFLLLYVTNGVAQSGGIIKGVVLLDNGQSAIGATVEVKGLGVLAVTDEQGAFSISNLTTGSYEVLVTYFGKEPVSKSVKVSDSAMSSLHYVLDVDQVHHLSEVVMTMKSENEKAKRAIVKAEIVDTKAVQEQAVTLVEMMNRSAGIRVRQSGGLGSNTNIVLNGFQGKSIKLLKDGIPLDYLGAGYNISSTPVNMMERVEVYKGVLPTTIGADALGGAINMVSKKVNDRSVAVSYELGSFNTHRVSFNFNHTSDDNRFFIGTDLFYNYSDNNYRVDARVVNPETATVDVERVRLFHNRYRQFYSELYGGVYNLSWADELRFGINSFLVKRDNQFAALMERPFGASYAEEKAVAIPTLRYKKSFDEGKGQLDQFFAYSEIKGKQVDTLRGSYDWHGQYHPPINTGSVGESGRPTLANLTFTNFTSRTGLSYQLSDRHRIDMNVVINDYLRKGSDVYGPTSIGDHPVDLLSLPAEYTKVVGAIGWNGVFVNEFIESLLQVKYYMTSARGQEVNGRTGYLKDQTSRAESSKFGIAQSLKLNITEASYLRLSGELATRLPDQTEILGDGSYILSNTSIKPEQSINFNVGFTSQLGQKWTVEGNGFYRLTEDMILTAPINLIFAQSTNVESVKGIGVELDLSYVPWSWLTFQGNITYQDYRLFDIQEPLMKYLEGARLRNTPYLFSNLGATFQFSNVLSRQDALRAYYNFSYVHAYYLNYIPKDAEPGGLLGLWGKAKVDAPNIIPSQAVHNLGVLWKPKQSLPLTINVECKNILDSNIYDNFKIQNAGRSFHVKLSYMLNY
ncbi:TonB-dependent receptor [Myroides pelagicus]|uniref:TonB-dependent receptor plug domain-containing protein n=1 Tax=Myroides pelagicus TaxID=270914 RepID=A0A7K1GIB9_9FLAO|nr:TonB-dependent receptor [Myroides pelagicus]MTH28520.1 TonB-dependent receptor plug domain-containing protein [Myroides pelagicus]